MKKIITIIFLAFPVFAFADMKLAEQCTFETDDLWIKLINLCEEGELSCDKMVYIGLNKKTGYFITLTGKSVISKRNYNFLYYEFINNDTTYMITRDNNLEITQGGKLILSKNLTSCQ